MTAILKLGFAVVLCAALLSPESQTLWGFNRAAWVHEANEIPPSSEAIIAFSFDIQNLVTNHQFAGQRNTFHVTYEYAGGLTGGGFDTKGHSVSPDTYPYFQLVRNDLLAYIKDYPNKNNFYEVFGMDICAYLLGRYPQIKRIVLKVDVPAYRDINIDRTETITLTRAANRAGK